MIEVEIIAASVAADRGLRALADLAAAAHGSNYRVVGGHMVNLLTRIYPTTDTVARVTADADAGMDTVVAADAALHDGLLTRGYQLVKGNHYEAPSGADVPLSVDLLVPGTGTRALERVEYAGRGFDAIPGLNLALAAEPLSVRVQAQLTTTQTMTFDVTIPHVEQAIVLKALAWRSRLASKDVTDLCALMAITHDHRQHFPEWKLDSARKGARGDAAQTLHDLASMVDRGRQRDGLTLPPGRFTALIRRYIADPNTGHVAGAPLSQRRASSEAVSDDVLAAVSAAMQGHRRRPQRGKSDGITPPQSTQETSLGAGPEPEPPHHHSL
ncbi:hypothetical protein IM25_23970 (plasmid) [Rhodococcus sp. p52]|uniref:hypothetical protein n=1 Tax=Rhodococcus sp. p52 TaxID=935199 RepID=UPI00068B84BD|nr:hypothetical protein [Rhodococcus sp. p52]AOD24809.1 hypothetical protein IM25_23970 [Rhodococcus sp. p52]